MTRLARWYEEVHKSGFESFGAVARTVQMHYQRIVSLFSGRSTNAVTESFNAKIKGFRAQLRGVKYIAFSLFRYIQSFSILV